MKYLLPILLLMISLNAFGADTLIRDNVSVKNRHIVGIGIGFPNAISRNYMRGNYVDRSIFPVTYFNYEYGFTNNISIKADLAFFQEKAAYTFSTAVNNFGTGMSYNTVTAYMINPQIVYYFFQNEIIALSASAGASFRNRTSDYSINAYENWKDGEQFGVIPSGKIGARIALGNSGLGLKLDVGYDWMSFMQFGINYKL